MTHPSYARIGPPFAFQGTLTDTQQTAFQTWDAVNRGQFPAISRFRQIQAQQLRKAAGLLEAFYASAAHPGAAAPLSPSFQKDTWQPDPGGHFLPTQRDDHLPGVVVGTILDRYQEQLGALGEGAFRLNYLRTQIEGLEDEAQDAAEAPAFIAAQMTQLDQLATQAHYAGVMIATTAASLFMGQPRYRAHPLDPPTPWERLNAGELLA
jgi:hypothetical protein